MLKLTPMVCGMSALPSSRVYFAPRAGLGSFSVWVCLAAGTDAGADEDAAAASCMCVSAAWAAGRVGRRLELALEASFALALPFST